MSAHEQIRPIHCTHRLRRRWTWAVLVAAAAGLCTVCHAQASGAQGNTATHSSADRVPLDRIVAIVNDDLILESDVDAEQRFAAFEPLRAEGPETRKEIVDRLIDRDLIQQQMQMQPPPPVSDAGLDRELSALRKSIPACAPYHCETEAGWQRFCADHGFTPAEVRARWRTRMEILRFIEQRFRMGIVISQQDIDNYYNTKLVPAYRKQGLAPPAENTLTDRIQQVLLQQEVSGLLDDWIKALRAEGSVRILVPDEAPAAAPEKDRP